MNISEKGLSLIKKFEGLVLKTYKCSAGVDTIGYGHTKTAKPKMVITEAKASELLLEDIRESELAVNRLVKVPLTQNQFDALVCFVFNVGSGNFNSSTLLKQLNQKMYKEAADQLLRWNKAGGKALPGLTRRREAERELFLS